MKNFFSKHGMKIGVVAVIVLLLVIVKFQYDAKNRDDAINKSLVQMKQLQDGIVRSQAKYGTKEDLEKFAKDNKLNIDAIKDDLATLGADLKGISKIVARSTGRHGTNIPSSGTTPRPVDPDNPIPPNQCDDPSGETCYKDPYGFQSEGQVLGLSEPFSNGTEVPIGDVTFEAWKENPWSMTIHPREYNVYTTLGQDEDGRHYVHNKFTIDADGKTHEIPIEQAEFIEKYPEPEFHFNPKIHLGVDIGATVTDTRAEVIPTVQVSLFSYGKTKTYRDTDWSFLGVGVGYGTQGESFNVTLSPVGYNVGQHIPLLENVHIAPTIAVDHRGDFFIGGGLRVGM